MIVAWLALDETAISFKSFSPYTPRLFAESCTAPFGPVVESAAPPGLLGVAGVAVGVWLVPIGDPFPVGALPPPLESLPVPGDPPAKFGNGAAIARIATFSGISSPFFRIALSN